MGNQSTAHRIHLMIVDDHQMFIDSLQARLDMEDGIVVEAISSSCEHALNILKGKHQIIDIVLLDLGLPNARVGKSCAQHIRELYGEDVKIIIITASDDRGRDIEEMLKIGVDGYVFKKSSGQVLIDAIHRVAQHGTYICKEAQKKLTEHLRDHKAEATPPLREPERQVLDLTLKEYTIQQISEELGMPESTVNMHRRNLMNNCGATSVAGLVREAILRKWVDLDEWVKE